MRNVNGQSFALNCNIKNRLVSVSGAATASFVYDADGKQVKTVVNGVTTYYVGNHYEVKNSVVTKYYFAGATRLAVRTGGTLSFLLADHIGSSSLTTDANGLVVGESLYKAFGESRYLSGTLNTDYKFTGQREESALGIYWFQSRWMDPSLGRFTQSDSIVPTSTQGTQAWDRYAFVNNNPVRYNDPTGHTECDNSDESGNCLDPTGLEGVLLHKYGWMVEGEWAEKDLQQILVAGNKINTFINSIIPGKSQAWMDKFMGGTTFVHGNLFGNSYVMGSTVHLADVFGGARWVTHELAHVYDNRSALDMGSPLEALWFGGGNADLMHELLGGGVPQGLEWINGTSFMPITYQYPNGAYANHSTADYFAETFALSIHEPSYPFPGDAVWGPVMLLKAFISAEGLFLP